jgi:hypothetical protein
MWRLIFLNLNESNFVAMSWTLPRLGEVRLFFWADGPTVVGEAKSSQKIFTVYRERQMKRFK